jgi:lipoprotein-anchoring transpeptidase ErfK/SrfK
MWIRRAAVPVIFALSGCAQAEPLPVSIAAEPTVLVDEPAPVAAPIAAPMLADAAPPPPDPEAIEREREARMLARFEEQHPFHGVVYHFLAHVRARPDARSAIVGYMRRGAQFRAEDAVRGPGCARWHRVPGGGYVCRGEGYQLGAEPQTFSPSPVQPALDGALPYAYAWVARDHAPQYWRLPTRAEEEEVAQWIRRQVAREDEPEVPVAPAPVEEGEPVAAPEPGLEAPPGIVDGAERRAEPDNEQPSILRMRMRRGFYVSVDALETSDGRRFYRTIRGAYVPADVLTEASPPDQRGVVLGGRWDLPLGFVYRGGVRTLTRDAARNTLALGDAIERGTPFPLSDQIIERRGARYRVSDRGTIVREDAMRIAEVRARPASVPEGARWIHVDLARQMLVAYEGDRPVFAGLVSTGRAGFETPRGTFRIQSKHVSTTMDDPDAGAEAYSIEDVPWTMYFQDSYALHAAFWHEGFGRPRSHGCVNLAPADARWLFQWSTPALPPGWHGMVSPRNEGTYVFVE